MFSMRQDPYREMELYQCVPSVVVATNTLQNCSYALILEPSFLLKQPCLWLSSSIHDLIKTYSFYLCFCFLVSILNRYFWVTSSLLIQSYSNFGLASRNYAIHEGNLALIMEISQSWQGAHPWAWGLHSHGWQPNTNLRNYIIHSLSLETLKCT